jgi:hypothetical protein
MLTFARRPKVCASASRLQHLITAHSEHFLQ